MAAKPASAKSVTWATEDFNLAASGQLHLLVDDLERDGRLGREVLAQLASANFRGDCLLPESMSTVYDSGGLSIRRQAVKASGGLSGTKRGVEGLAESFAGLLSDWAGWSDIHLHFKITSVDLEPDRATTRVLFEAGARRGDRFIQLRGWWSCVWELNGKAAPRLLGMRIESHEEVAGTSRGGRLLVDSTAAVLKPAGEVVEQLSRSVDHWRGRLQAELGVALHGHQGLAIGDVNGDGLEDIYLAQPGGMPNRLLIQQPDGTVIDAAGSAGVDWLDRSRSALLVDFDNDGDQDLACVLNVNLVLMENDGSGHFVERDVVFSTGDPYSLAAADFDGDGDLDLYVTGYGAGFLTNRLGEGAAAPIPYPYHDANNGGSNLLLRNDGDWQS
ncbi:MAG: VCBS repeat-containing protein, partial [Planctomycetaceae bacterium]